MTVLQDCVQGKFFEFKISKPEPLLTAAGYSSRSKVGVTVRRDGLEKSYPYHPVLVHANDPTVYQASGVTRTRAKQDRINFYRSIFTQHWLQITTSGFVMVKKRAETTDMKRKRGTITSHAKESLDVECDRNCWTNSSRARRSRSSKRDPKSVEQASSEKRSENQHDSREMQKQSPSKKPRKRNASLGQSESPSKKAKVESGNSKQNSAKKATKNTSITKEAPENKVPQNIPSKEQEVTSLKHTGKSRSAGKIRPAEQTSQSAPTKQNLKMDCTPSPTKKRQSIGKKLELNSTCHGTAEGKSTLALLQEQDKASSDESSDSEGVAWQDVDEADVDHEVDDKKASGLSTSKGHESPSKKNVEISICTLPGAKNKRKGCQEDVMKLIKRAINRFKKEMNLAVHKVHLLTLVGHGFFRNKICNDPLLQAVLLSHIPNNFVMSNKRKWDIAQLTNFLKWLQSKFSSMDVIKTGDAETDKKIARIQNLSEVFVIVLRAQGFLTRLVCSLQPLSAKGESERKTSPKWAKKKSFPGSRTAVNSKVVLDTTKKSETTKEQEDVTQGSFDKTVTKPNKQTFDDEMGNNGEESREGNSQGPTKTNNNNNNKKVLKSNDEKEEHKNNSSKRKTMKKRPLRKRKKIDYSLSGSDSENDGDEEWDKKSSDSEESEREEESSQTETTLKKRNKTPVARKGKLQTNYDSCSSAQNESSSMSFVDLMDSDSDFEVTSKPLMKRRILGKGLGRQRNKILSDDSDESMKCAGIETFAKKGADWWSEVYLPCDKKWICIHLESSSVNHPELCEEHASQPLVYVVSFDNDNAAKDVTNRYASCWMSKTQKLRTDSDWWEKSLLPYHMKSKKLDKMENSQLEGQLLEKPLPNTITEYKNHPLYVLKRHLLKFEAIYPESAAILGYCRGEAVYSRDCVHQLHTREKWLNEALVVKKGEKAYKVVKGRPKKNQPIHERDSVTIDLFGRWQTEDYKPPPAKDGKVPRNEYGNVELFKECMLPPGTKHVKIPGIQRVAKKLGIDCAQAVVGFDFHCGFSHPVIDGVVVCEEYERVLLDAWREEEEETERKKTEKREKRLLGNWRLLTRSLLIRERLKKRYNNQESKMEDSSVKDEEDEVVASTSVSWPLNRQEGRGSMAINGHCHVFLKSSHKQDPVTGEWSKSCSCGLTLPFEKM